MLQDKINNKEKISLELFDELATNIQNSYFKSKKEAENKIINQKKLFDEKIEILSNNIEIK